MKPSILKHSLCPLAAALAFASTAQAGITLYDEDGTTFSADGHFNAFFVQTNDKETNEEQSRVRMGFLPNWLGFDVSKKQNGLTLGGRSSFWVSINDSNSSATDTAIDVRQFYGTVDGQYGQFLFGKDFGLYARSNIFNDELLLGTGLPQTNGTGVTFGNISTGYPYTTPVAQLTYRTPDMNGLKLAVGVMDPATGSTATSNTSDTARLEAEATYGGSFDGGNYSLWLGGASGSDDSTNVDARGLAYGARVALGGLQLTASGFDQEGINATLANVVLGSETESSGYLTQASYSTGPHRFVLSHGETEVKGTSDTTTELDSLAYFYDVTESLKLIAEYDVKSETGKKDTDQFAIGAALSW